MWRPGTNDPTWPTRIRIGSSPMRGNRNSEGHLDALVSLKEQAMKNFCKVAFLLVASLLVSACGGGNNQGTIPDLKSLIVIPNVTAGTNFSFDIAAVDRATGRFYFTDRNNKSVDVIDTSTNKLVKQIFGGFAGCNTGAS